MDQYDQIKQLTRYQLHPEDFVRECLHAEPEPYQVDILQACVHSDKVAATTGHGVGKTTCCAWIVIWWMFCFQDPKAVTTAPTWRQVKDLLWAEIHFWVKRADLSKVFWTTGYDINKTRLELSDDSYATGESVGDPRKIEGYHARNMLYVVDEAKGVPDETFDAIEGALTSGAETGGRSLRVYVSTPGPCSGKHYKICTGVERGWTVIRVNGEDSRRVSRDWLRDRAEVWGTDSFLYKTRVMGKHDCRAGDVVIPVDTAEMGWAQHVELPSDLVPELGVDVAHSGDDSTVIAARQGNCLTYLNEWNKRDTVWTADMAALMADRIASRAKVKRGRIRIKIDTIGLGVGVADNLARRGYAVVRINSSSRAFEEDKFHNRRAEFWFATAERLKLGRMDLSRCPPRLKDQLVADLASCAYKLDLQGRFLIERKEDVKKRLHRSPDLADAIMLAFAKPSSGVRMGGTALLPGRAGLLQSEQPRAADVRAFKSKLPIIMGGSRRR